MVKGYDTIPFTKYQHASIKQIHQLCQKMEDEGFQNSEARALISLLNHLSEGSVLDTGYIIQKLGMLFTDYRFKVKTY